ncbi:Acetylglutamate kinase protein [Halorhabdus tiamatea SARL4B]|uniref:Putative [LysW]-aminoadipate/[LysW]-glutamate kinase n=1 Tax=Halorhabdus tiamatea SARL4B TaxID=1033806 RepID=F7PNU6_9EURY|nr:acetylglutamate/acetylaminoadipate kinase [Halorhabdus tiamatea]ERJ06746.1 Acetylglutamate kinase protein [Halorhabdus tiamatea SARL4B]CCQ33668.1 acetylglutamate kinase / acetylamin oadipate kinase [Halorhabdus tiamatea SARL4B]
MTVVVKVGGARAVDPEGALADVAQLVADGEDVVVVHGGSTKVDDTLERIGIEPEYVETPSGVVGRFTDEETMEVFEMAFGHLNTQLVAGLQSQGVDAVGLNGVDGKLLAGPRKSAVRVLEDGKRKIKRGDHSGSIEEVNEKLLYTLLDDGYTPVAGPPMAGREERSAPENASSAERSSANSRAAKPRDDGDGQEPRAEWLPVNTDADRSAAAIAGALDATLVLLTDVAGVYADPDDPETLIESAETDEEWNALQDAAEGFMERKVMAVEEALGEGAPEVVIADANAEEPISAALEGSGTHVMETAIETEDKS